MHLKDFKDYLLGFLAVIMFAVLYGGSYTYWRAGYTFRLEVCDTNEWYVALPRGPLYTFYRPAVEVDRALRARATTISVVD